VVFIIINKTQIKLLPISNQYRENNTHENKEEYNPWIFNQTKKIRDLLNTSSFILCKIVVFSQNCFEFFLFEKFENKKIKHFIILVLIYFIKMVIMEHNQGENWCSQE